MQTLHNAPFNEKKGDPIDKWLTAHPNATSIIGLVILIVAVVGILMLCATHGT